MAAYAFPTQRLKRTMEDPQKTPIALVYCGSFSPITNTHLRTLELAADHAKFSTNYEVVGAYISPVSDAYRKAGLTSSKHRLNMCQLAVNEDSSGIMVDDWEARKEYYTPTTELLRHFHTSLNTDFNGVASFPGLRKPISIVLVAGGDLVQTMSNPKLWSFQDIEHILDKYSVFMVERTGTDTGRALAPLSRWKGNIHVIQDNVHHDSSSTKIRQYLTAGLSVRYLIPNPVVAYIEEHALYQGEQVQCLD
ncbi:hypothetical protein B0O99DRAFT_664231 [Bisporella sp. PMI_857]|nr:hypothetical protein B0O99DRAFT_664231 [Bisporella sp. PMI_857]